MDFEIAAILFQDGIANGAIYTMLALGFVLVFTTTRVIFASYGDLIAFSALTLHAIQNGKLPGTVYILGVLAVLAASAECWSLLRERTYWKIPTALLLWLVIPLLPVGLVVALQGVDLNMVGQILVAMAVVVPIAPLLYRVVFQPIETSSTLTLLIVALVLHYALAGLAMVMFGAEGVRTAAFLGGSLTIFGFQFQSQLVIVLVMAGLLSAGLALFFNATLTGKALRATAYNRDGARLVGISTRRSSSIAFILAGLIAAVIGILIAPTVTIYYDSGLMIGLKGFVGAVLGGFVSYPLATLGSVLVGLVEAYASFFASSFKEIIVFLAVIPIVLTRWLWARHEVEDEEEHA
ncbi:branched-chain amino acid ABC transporter permease [Arvimicrobium flavum]|uniref:branched-chain amino acid ABC transporter permease n=1 Tax=Arvimicrobium flavum TaxID=3393320 RepID=UPI00237AA816|nr:branched-chain amino acid ABC transporter permease [Mesorhizobium shangrilense]